MTLENVIVPKEHETFFIQGSPTGVLLVHGFTGSPAELLSLANDLHKQHGWSILGIRLDGHGTRPEDLAQHTRFDWRNNIISGVRELQKSCATVFIVGQSMGGWLAIYASLHLGSEITGICLLAVPYTLVGFSSRYLLPAVERLEHYIPKLGRYFWPKRNRDMADPSRVQASTYDRFSVAGLAQFYRFIKEMRPLLPQVKSPVLQIHAVHDNTADFNTSTEFYQKLASVDKTFVKLERSQHVISADVESDFVATTIGAWIQKRIEPKSL